jgi:tripartite-type tricarboxylate transporter receptor subunit TctC
MKLARRSFLQLAGGVTALPAVSRIACAETYPTRPVHLIVGFPPGGPGDILARLIAQSLSERLGRSFVVENRPGASNNIATEAVVRAPADGYTLLQITASNAISVTLYQNLNFDFVRDLVPIAGTARAPLVMEVNPSVPVKTVPEFIAYAKANPGKINYATPGNGTSGHLAAELFKMMAGINLVHVPYRGGAPALTDLLGGQVQALFDPIPASLAYIRNGQLRALAVTTANRSPALPDVPTVAEFVPGYKVSNWWGICAPKNTPMQIVDKLNSEINAALADPKMKARFADLATEPMPMTAAEFKKFIADEAERWAKVIKFAGIKGE